MLLCKRKLKRPPLSVIIDYDLFDKMKRDVESQNLKTINAIEEVKHIINFDPVADFEKFKSQRSELRAVEMKWRNMKRYGSIDKERKLNFYEIQEEKRRFFCSNIKIKPEILICYIIDHIDLFSSEIEIPSKLGKILSEKSIQGKDHNTETKLSLEDQLNKLIIKLTPEIELLYEEIKTIARKDKRTTQDLRYQDGKAAFEKLKNKLQVIEFHDLNPDTFATGKPFREIKGGLLRKVAMRKIPGLIGNKKNIKIAGQALYKRMTDLKKTS